MTAKELQKRNERSQHLRAIQVDEDTYYVESSEGKICYRVMFEGDSITCTCGDFSRDIKADTNFRCKHIISFFNSIADTDSDGMWDEWEVQQFTDLITAGATSDFDLDGLLDKDEFLYGTGTKNKDSDGDGVEEGLEVQVGMNPSLAGDYNIDSDGDTYSNLREQISGTDPYNVASVPLVLADGDPSASGDGDVDGKDLTGLISEFGRTNCSPCEYDLDTDGDVDLADLFLFSEDFGRTTP